jgi:hypothetical protein
MQLRASCPVLLTYSKLKMRKFHTIRWIHFLWPFLCYFWGALMAKVMGVDSDSDVDRDVDRDRDIEVEVVRLVDISFMFFFTSVGGDIVVVLAFWIVSSFGSLWFSKGLMVWFRWDLFPLSLLFHLLICRSKQASKRLEAPVILTRLQASDLLLLLFKLELVHVHCWRFTGGGFILNLVRSWSWFSLGSCSDLSFVLCLLVLGQKIRISKYCTSGKNSAG